MGVVTVSTSAARIPLRLSEKYLNSRSSVKKPIILSFKNEKEKNAALVSARESVVLPLDVNKEKGKSLRKVKKRAERVNAVSTNEAPPTTYDLDYNEAAAKLEYIFKQSPATDISVEEVKDQRVKKRQIRKRIVREAEEEDKRSADNVVRSQGKGKRLNLEKRIALKENRGEFVISSQRRKDKNNDEDEKVDKLVRNYSASTSFDMVSSDWKKMKIPPVLPSSEHAWLFNLMQPMKAILQVKESIQQKLGRELTDNELAVAANMDALQLRKQLNVGKAARSKLIKHNLRLVLFAMNKHFRDLANGPSFQDLCQAGVTGLITAIDRFDPTRKSRLSTYGLFWIRHAISRSITLSNSTKISFGLDSIRVKIHKVKLELLFELQRLPTKEQIIDRLGVTPARYDDVMRASKPVLSLHARHPVTQEEFINGITDANDVEGDNSRQPALVRLAIDDVLDSLKPKENLVIRQRYGLDGKGNRTLGEIAGNLNISREMVRKHEMKALMKLKHPTRIDYLHSSISS